MPLRLPFTLVSLAGLSIRAVRTDAATGDVRARVLQRVGFAPRDLLLFSWRRMIQSALFTHGGLEFWAAVAMIAIAVGAAELLVGSVRAFAMFWGVHIATLLAESLLIALPLALAGAAFGTRLSDVRDVGPSAGYVGALGVVCAWFPRRMRSTVVVVVAASLLTVMLVPTGSPRSDAVQVSAGIAHLIAFPMGLALGMFWWSRRRVTESGPSGVL
jgi:hypothetical protein